MSLLNSTLNDGIKETHEQQQALSFIVGIVIICTIAGIGLIVFVYFLFRRLNDKEDIEPPNIMRKVFSNSQQSDQSRKCFRNSQYMTSSLDTHDALFSTILEYTPTIPPPTTTSNSKRHTEVLSYCHEDKYNLKLDPISVSLARYSIEERAGYYKSPTRTPIPYYQHYGASSSTPKSSTNKMFMEDEIGESDEDRKMMQRWSNSLYQVW